MIAFLHPFAVAAVRDAMIADGIAPAAAAAAARAQVAAAGPAQVLVQEARAARASSGASFAPLIVAVDDLRLEIWLASADAPDLIGAALWADGHCIAERIVWVDDPPVASAALLDALLRDCRAA